MVEELLEDNEKLVSKFGAKPISSIKNLPDFYSFTNGLFYSHRDFDQFLKALEKGEKCALVSGVNASGTLHLGHKPVFDTNLYFQKTYGLPIYIPISDDESYVTGKVASQEQGLEYARQLAKEMLAYGFDPKNTFFIIDQIYTNIYNFAIKLSKKVTVSEILATYGYTNSDNPGMYFYPAIQSAHILFPQHEKKIDNVLVIIGPDEDAHIRIGRDLAARFKIKKPSILHSKFMAGTDSQKMSKSKNNAIYLKDSAKDIKKKINKAFSGGQETIEEHRKLGGNPDVDIACQYLKDFYLTASQTKDLFDSYRKGELLSGEVKQQLITHVTEELLSFQKRIETITDTQIDSCILKNKE